jgi:hypothetical protein
MVRAGVAVHADAWVALGLGATGHWTNGMKVTLDQLNLIEGRVDTATQLSTDMVGGQAEAIADDYPALRLVLPADVRCLTFRCTARAFEVTARLYTSRHIQTL